MRQASNHSTCPKGEGPRGENRARLYDEVTGRIIAQLEAGRFPWVQPWGTGGLWCGAGSRPPP
jgi:antirestriction protein ArdC